MAIEFYVKLRDQTDLFLTAVLLVNAEWVRDTDDGWSMYLCSEEAYAQLSKKFPGRAKRS
ncbi:hypothetical protein BSZ19_46945 [Bradyrhizobium japonicum]|uniref:Uncharacterized protein n=1 Tax=Bradyrhizobium japonicum TaxID=375 RepID=A0A1Y2J7N7_BRAJP|nr:hypothetical protein BSZ19_46945 [Bradyrhizobium japonicum]